MMKVLIQFVNEQHWINFRFAELDSLLELNGLVPDDIYTKPAAPVKDDIHNYSPFVIANFPANSEKVIEAICSRSVMIKQILRLWDYAPNISELITKMAACSNGKNERDDKLSCYHRMHMDEGEDLHKTFGMKVETFSHSIPGARKEQLRASLPFKPCYTGGVNLKDPERLIMLIMDFQHEHMGVQNTQSEFDLEKSINSVPCYLGVLIARGGMKAELMKYDLKNRLFIGPTSLDHALSLITCNLAHVTADCVVLDPFVGTASLLIAASHFKAFCFGSDIDIRVLKGDMYAGKHKDDKKRDIVENFKAYNLQSPELVRIDNHLFTEHMQCRDHPVVKEFYDCIITDPPYGIRAGARKSGRKGINYVVPAELRYDHTPHTQNYAVEEVMLDLLHTAAISLRVGGTLAYVIPTPYDFALTDLPVHPCMERIQCCHQNLSTRHGRHVVVMRKTKTYTEQREEEYKRYCHDMLTLDPSADNAGFGGLIHKLEKALSNTASTDDSVIRKMSNGCAKRKIAKDRRKAYNIAKKEEAQKTEEIPAVSSATAAPNA